MIQALKNLLYGYGGKPSNACGGKRIDISEYKDCDVEAIYQNSAVGKGKSALYLSVNVYDGDKSGSAFCYFSKFKRPEKVIENTIERAYQNL